MDIMELLASISGRDVCSKIGTRRVGCPRPQSSQSSSGWACDVVLKISSWLALSRHGAECDVALVGLVVTPCTRCCAGAICTAERARRAAARVAHEEETQALARTWRNLQRSLSGERGLWADAASCEALHWKLDKTEDPSRRHAPLPMPTCLF